MHVCGAVCSEPTAWFASLVSLSPRLSDRQGITADKIAQKQTQVFHKNTRSLVTDDTIPNKS